MFSLARQRLFHKTFKVLRLTFVDFSNLHDIKNLNLVRTIEKTIDRNTSLFIESPIHVKVHPIDVNDMNAHDKLTMTLYSKGKEASDIQVTQSAKKLELRNKSVNSDRSDVCVIQVPYQITMKITTTDLATVELAKLESQAFTIKTGKGSVLIKDLKAQEIDVQSEGGEVMSEGRLQASKITLKTGKNSNIKCNNIMANELKVSTHAGSISVNSCYSDNSHFTTLMGNIKLDRLHKNVTIDVIQNGNLHITGFAGTLQASLKSGDVYMRASELIDKNSIFIHEKGKVVLLIPNIVENLPATSLIAEKINVDEKILKMGRFMDDSNPKTFRFEKEQRNELHIVCRNGSIDLKETSNSLFVY